jgi:hypothetical protein
MERPLISYDKELMRKGFAVAVRENTHYYVNKYLTTSSHFETPLTRIRYTTFFPGRVYTYHYYPIGRKKLDFYDLKPITLILAKKSLKKKRSILYTGINFNYIPNTFRANVMDLYYTAYRTQLESDMIPQMSDNIQIAPGYLFSPDFNFSLNFRTLLQQHYGDKFKLSIRKYRTEMISSIKLVEYTDWYKTAFISSDHYVRTNLNEVHKRWLENAK